MLGEDRLDGETLFDLNASVQMRAGEWDRIWLRDKAELPRLHRALHACLSEAAKDEHSRPPISDEALARAVALLRNRRDHWTPLELKALPDVAIASLAFILRPIDVRLAIPLQCLAKSHLSAAQARWWREAHRASVPASRPLEQLPCRFDP